MILCKTIGKASPTALNGCFLFPRLFVYLLLTFVSEGKSDITANGGNLSIINTANTNHCRCDLMRIFFDNPDLYPDSFLNVFCAINKPAKPGRKKKAANNIFSFLISNYQCTLIKMPW